MSYFVENLCLSTAGKWFIIKETMTGGNHDFGGKKRGVRMTECFRRRLELDGREAELEYALLSKEIEIEGVSVVTYGISVKMLEGESLVHTEIHDIAPDREAICFLLERICSGAVLPQNLIDIVEDFIA